MKLEDITHVFCLSCVLMIFCVSSQESCRSGWFGKQCKYKCRCTNTSCDVSGLCVKPFVCEGGWFGPACQYADLAYNTQNLTEITDGNDTTCIAANAGDTIHIPFSVSYVFTWLRIYVSDQGSDVLRNLTVTFNTSSVPCPKWREQAVSKTILDMHCDLSETIDAITLTGHAVPHLCSVYVSGGRNVALQETAWQPADYNETIGGEYVRYGASKAVDGGTNQNLHDFSCTSTFGNVAIWILTLSMQRRVNRYVIYNRDIIRYRLNNFMLESYDVMNSSVFVYKDIAAHYEYIYTIVHSPLPVQMVVVSVNNTENVLTLCEVEVYGESACDPQHYGRDCEHVCQCVNNEACFVSTGGCPSGCSGGFRGDTCNDVCPGGKVGTYCNLTCSPNCQPVQNKNTPACENNRVCRAQCAAGFFGPSCDTECHVGKFGVNCNESCNPNCAGYGQATVYSCDTKTGNCLKGCKSGFMGAMCNMDMAKASVAATGVPMELVVGLVALFLVLTMAAFCVIRKGRSPPAAEGATPNEPQE